MKTLKFTLIRLRILNQVILQDPRLRKPEPSDFYLVGKWQTKAKELEKKIIKSEDLEGEHDLEIEDEVYELIRGWFTDRKRNIDGKEQNIGYLLKGSRPKVVEIKGEQQIIADPIKDIVPPDLVMELYEVFEYKPE